MYVVCVGEGEGRGDLDIRELQQIVAYTYGKWDIITRKGGEKTGTQPVQTYHLCKSHKHIGVGVGVCL